MIAERKAWRNERLRELYGEWYKIDFAAGMFPFQKFTRPVSLSPTPKLPALLKRSDGQTILYEGRLNTIYGEPAQGKTWIAIITVIEAIRSGARVVFWDFEDKPETLATRLDALGAADLIGSPELAYAVPGLADAQNSLPAIGSFCQWMEWGQRPGLVVIDSAESAGCPSDGSAVPQWYEKHVDPWIHGGAGVLLLDHVPKRREDRPRGGIGSQHKLARVTGAALYVQGQAWTKTANGQITVKLHKDRQGDLPSVMGKAVATITGVHQDGAIRYTIEPPGKGDEVDVTDDLLWEIAKLGSEGVTGSRAVRALVKARGKDVDAALNDLLSSGLVGRFKAGQAWVYHATDEGMFAVEQGGD